jgi:hypothetical protein
MFIMKKIALFAAAATAGSSAFAADLATLTSGISFADVGIAVLAVAGTLIALNVTIKGAKQVIAFVGK